MYTLVRKYIVSIVAVALWNGPIPATSAQQNADQLLDNIKQALIDGSIDNGVSLISSGYVDSSGRLIESTYFTTDTDVAGIRVLEYLPEENRSQFLGNISKLPPALKGFFEKGCMEAESGIRSNAVFGINQQTRHLNHLIDPIAQLLMSEIRKIWNVSLDQSETFTSSYMQAYLGKKRDMHADHRISVYLRELDGPSVKQNIKSQIQSLPKNGISVISRFAGVNPLVEIPPIHSSKYYYFELILGIENLIYPEKSVKNVFDFSVRSDRNILKNINISDDVLRRVKSIYTEWFDAYTNQLCTNQVLYVKYNEENQSIKINAGTINGVQQGDNFVLLNSNLLNENNVLNLDLSENLAVAEVVEVANDYSVLKLISSVNQVLTGVDIALPF